MQEPESEGAAGHSMWFVTSFSAAQQRALSQALPLLWVQGYDLKLQATSTAGKYKVSQKEPPEVLCCISKFGHVCQAEVSALHRLLF